MTTAGWSSRNGVSWVFLAAFLVFAAWGSAEAQVDQAEIFPFSVEQVDEDRLVARWDVAEDHYLYRHAMDFHLDDGDNEVARVSFPAGEKFSDEFFGDVEIYRGTLQVHIETAQPLGEQARLKAEFQGCNEPDSLCYPPSSAEFDLASGEVAYEATGAAPQGGSGAGGAAGALGDLERLLGSGSLMAVLGGFFVAGLLLAFTACLYPMIPILSGLIVGAHQGAQRPGTGRSLWLSFVYVQGMAVTYALAGALAGLSGRAVQADLQGPAASIGFSLLFVALAAAMFGLYSLQMPASLQSRLQAASSRLPGGQASGVAAMGALSTLIVGACSGPALVAALAFIGNTGEVGLGALALYVMALGMGLPLLAVGTAAGRWMPRSGAWMESVKQVFGFIFLGVAWWMSARLVPDWVELAGWGALLLAASVWLIVQVRRGSSGAAGVRVAGGVVASLVAVAGAAQLLGAATGAGDPLRPWVGLTGDRLAEARAQVLEEWQHVSGLEEFEAALAEAREGGRPVVVDVSAEWCVYCVQLEERTLPDDRVRERLEGVDKLRVDVTSMTDEDRALMEAYGVYLPPAILFFGPDGEERSEYRVAGFEGPEAFAERLDEVFEGG